MTSAPVAERLAFLGLTLPEQTSPQHPYLAVREDAGLLYLSGKTASLDGVVQYRGIIGEPNLEQGREAARLCALQVLSAIDHSVGLDRVKGILKLTVFVASEPNFVRQPEVANAASQLFVDVLGQAGQHTRSAVGVASLPGGSSVEIEAIVRLTEGAR